MNGVEFLDYAEAMGDQYLLGVVTVKMRLYFGKGEGGKERFSPVLVRFKHLKGKTGTAYFAPATIGIVKGESKEWIRDFEFEIVSDREELFSYLTKCVENQKKSSGLPF